MRRGGSCTARMACIWRCFRHAVGAEVMARQDAGTGPSVFAIAHRRPPDVRKG